MKEDRYNKAVQNERDVLQEYACGVKVELKEVNQLSPRQMRGIILGVAAMLVFIFVVAIPGRETRELNRATKLLSSITYDHEPIHFRVTTDLDVIERFNAKVSERERQLELIADFNALLEKYKSR